MSRTNLSSLGKSIQSGRSARFFKVSNKPSDTQLRKLLKTIIGKKVDIVEISIRRTVDDAPDVKISYVVISKEKQVPFLKNSKYKDTTHGLLMLIELDNYALILTSKISVSSEDLSGYYSKLDYNTLVGAQLSGQVNLQKIRTKSMLNTFDGCHNRTFEGENLQTNLGSMSNNRQILTSASLRKGRHRTSVQFNLSKLTDLGTKIDIPNLANWAKSTIRRVEAPSEVVDPFILSYAQEVTLPDDVLPIGILFHTWKIFDQIAEDEAHLKISRMQKLKRELNENEYRKIDALLSSRIDLVPKNGSYIIMADLDNELEDIPDNRKMKKRFGSLVIEGQKINLRLPLLNAILYDAEDTNYKTAHDIIIKGGHFSLIFNNPEYYYSNNRTVKDSNILNRAKILANIMNPAEILNPSHCLVEKGDSPDSHSYPSNSVFFFIDETFKHLNNSLLVCEDKSGEWADFILFDSQEGELTFFHAKASKNTTTRAGAFQEVVAQAIKNLGLITRDTSEYSEKLETEWLNGTWLNAPRFRCSDVSRDQAIEIIRSTVQNPFLKRKVSIVVNFLSKEDFDQSFADFENLDQNQIRLIWLLTDFVSSCKELGIIPEIICST